MMQRLIVGLLFTVLAAQANAAVVNADKYTLTIGDYAALSSASVSGSTITFSTTGMTGYVAETVGAFFEPGHGPTDSSALFDFGSVSFQAAAGYKISSIEIGGTAYSSFFSESFAYGYINLKDSEDPIYGSAESSASAGGTYEQNTDTLMPYISSVLTLETPVSYVDADLSIFIGAQLRLPFVDDNITPDEYDLYYSSAYIRQDSLFFKLTFVPDGTAVSAVPEPEVYGLLLAGLAMIGWSARRNRKQ
jgi:hypothetical protein